MTAVIEECWGGFYCPGADTAPNPVNYRCPAGVHCPNGSGIYMECAAGTFTDYIGASECGVCPEGSYCLPVAPENASLAYQPCPAGYYCPYGKMSLLEMDG